jgi:hypothetical protein
MDFVPNQLWSENSICFDLQGIADLAVRSR